MSNSKTILALAGIAMMGLALMAGNASAVEVYRSGDDSLNVNGRLQLLGALEHVDDPWKDPNRLFMFLQQARLGLSGNIKGVDYAVTWMLGGEEVPKSNSVMSLLDAYAIVPLIDELLEVKAGQFKVPYGRERLTDSGELLTTDRSIQNNFFNVGRDVGAAVLSRSGILTGAVGIFTGGGPNIPERYIPEDLEFPMFVGRVGVNTGVDRDVVTPFGGESEEDGVKVAAYLNGIYTGDSRVGHSTPLNVKYMDKSLMLNANWNPYIKARNERAEFNQVGGDVAVSIPVGDESDLVLSGEYNVANFHNNAGSLEVDGGLVDASLVMENLSIGIRYAFVNPDEKMAYTDADGVLYPVTSKQIQEITPHITYRLPQYNVTLKADLAYQIDVPVTREAGHGVYNLMRQPDSVATVTNDGLELQENYLLSMVLQYDF